MTATPHRAVPIAAPCLGEEEWQALREPIETGWLTQGPKVGAFERAFAEAHGVRRAVATSSCTTGLHLTLVGLGIGPGDEVIVPAFTWVATANVVLHCQAEPVFADVDPGTFNITPAEVARRLSPRTRAVIVVHLFGRCADVDAIRAVLPEGVALIEDAACAVGARHGDRSAGGLGTAGVFSFHPRKTITAGEGGMITTDDEALADRLVVMRNHGASVPEEVRHGGAQSYLLPAFETLGFNYRMTDLQGAVCLAQLAKLERFIAERAALAARYRAALADLPWAQTPEEPPGGRHGWQAFVIRIDPDAAPAPRDAVMAFLHDRGIATRPGTHAIHLLGYYRDRFGLRPGDFPGALDCDRNSLALPLHNRMSHEDAAHVIDALHSL